MPPTVEDRLRDVLDADPARVWDIVCNELPVLKTFVSGKLSSSKE
jgi:hypothetical protein